MVISGLNTSESWLTYQSNEAWYMVISGPRSYYSGANMMTGSCFLGNKYCSVFVGL
uniref:Uncharacterized protein n=1 Tax=Picea sitchensis TaxID=3332 RepID=A9NSJ8_PICSI|nr:unknown [Picea sitchensis]